MHGRLGEETHPPRKAPTGFLTGRGVTSARRRGEVVKARVEAVRRGADAKARILGARTLDAIIGCRSFVLGNWFIWATGQFIVETEVILRTVCLR